MLILKLALRNLTRNPVRTRLNLLMVIGTFCAIILFEGFSQYMLKSVEQSFVQGLDGHIQIAKSAIWNNDISKNKEDAYIKNFQAIQKQLAEIPEVQYSYGRANAYVLLSNASKSVGALAIGYDSKVAANVEKTLLIQAGAGFTHKEDYEILVSAGLQRQLNLIVGQTISVVAQSLPGAMSSIDPELRGIVSSGMKEQDDSVIYMPLASVQKLLETDRVERISILLKDNVDISTAVQKMKNAFKNQPELIIKSWKETATLMRQLTDFYKIQDRLVEIVLSLLVFFGILNTVCMSIYERIGEIGTMRALGDQRSEILALLILEGFLLGLVGAALATPISYLLAVGLSVLEIPVLMPGASQTMPIHIDPKWFNYLNATMAVVLCCLISTLVPAIKAIRISITEALRTNS